MKSPEQEFEDAVREFKRNLVRKKLLQCTKRQIAFFNRMHGSVETMNERSMKNAYGQCVRTLRKNENPL